MKAFSNFVGGERVEAEGGSTSEVVDPSTGRPYATAPLSSAHDVDAAMRAAAAAFEGWRDATPSTRSLALFRIADAVEARAEELIAAEVENTGKPVALTRSEEIPPAVDQLRFFATIHVPDLSRSEGSSREDGVQRDRSGRAGDDQHVPVRVLLKPRSHRPVPVCNVVGQSSEDLRCDTRRRLHEQVICMRHDECVGHAATEATARPPEPERSAERRPVGTARRERRAPARSTRSTRHLERHDNQITGSEPLDG